MGFFDKVWGGIKGAATSVYDHALKPVYNSVLKPVYNGVIKPIGEMGINRVKSLMGAGDKMIGAAGNVASGAGNVAVGMGDLFTGKSNILLYVGLGIVGVVVVSKLMDKL
jgi:hypothetical protein